MKIIVEFDEQEFMQFMEWRRVGASATVRIARSFISTRIEETELTQRTKDCLIAEGFITVADAQVKTDAELLKTPNLGRKGLREFRELYPVV